MTRRLVAIAAVLALLLVATACESRLGGADNSFGNNLGGDLDGDGVVDPGDCVNPEATCAGAQPLAWAAINSPYYQRDNGDPYAARCLTGTACSPDPSNPEHRPGGYRYAIEVAEPDQTVTVALYDAPVYNNPPLNYAYDSGSFRTQFELFGEDGSTATASTTPELSMDGQCSSGPGRRTFPGNYQSATYHNRWWTLCTFTAPVAGTYPLQVKVTDLAADATTGATACTTCTETTRGINSYAVKAITASGAPVEVSALGDMSIFTPSSSTTSRIPLIEVPSDKAGHHLVVDVFDPGDAGSGTSRITVLDDALVAAPACVAGKGAVGASRIDPPESSQNLSPCSLLTRDGTSNLFNGRWARLTVPIPQDYSCTSDCWWSLGSVYSTATSTDRLTVAASITEPS